MILLIKRNSKFIFLIILISIIIFFFNNCLLYNTEEYYYEGSIVIDPAKVALKIDENIYIIPISYSLSKTIKGFCVDTLPSKTLVLRELVLKVDTKLKKAWVLFSKSIPVELYIDFGGYKISNENLLISLITKEIKDIGKKKETIVDEEIITIKLIEPKLIKRVRVNIFSKDENIKTIRFEGDFQKSDYDVPIEINVSKSLFRDETAQQIIDNKEFQLKY